MTADRQLVPPSNVVIAQRAQSLLVEACLLSGARAILVPALYCPDVVLAIRASGLDVIYYDIELDLTPSLPSLEMRLHDDCAIIWHHPFGSYLAPPAYPGILTIEDACYSLRTITSFSLDYEQTSMCICSLRKEFQLSAGGLAFGHMIGQLRSRSCKTDHSVAGEFSRIDLASRVRAGQAMTRFILTAMGPRLPSIVASASVLSQIPLLGSRRDAVVDTLRAAGVMAWYWQSRVPDLTRGEAPRAWEVWERLFLVPLPKSQAAALDLAARIATG